MGSLYVVGEDADVRGGGGDDVCVEEREGEAVCAEALFLGTMTGGREEVREDVLVVVKGVFSGEEGDDDDVAAAVVVVVGCGSWLSPNSCFLFVFPKGRRFFFLREEEGDVLLLTEVLIVRVSVSECERMCVRVRGCPCSCIK